MRGCGAVVRWFICGLFFAGGVAGAATPRPYVLGVLPVVPPLATYDRWNPVVKRLSERVGAPIHLRLYDDMAQFEKDLVAGHVDLVYAHPFLMIEGRRAQRYEPLVRDRRRIAAVVFTRKDANIHGLEDLDGKRITVVGNMNYCARLLESMLLRAGLQARVERRASGSSLNAIRAVILGRAEAGALLDVSLEAVPEELRSQVRPVVSSRDTASHPLSAHPRVPAALRARIVRAVLEMAEDPGDRALLAAVKLSHPEPADYDRDYRPIERLWQASP